jgi:hypothetical protein
MKKTSIAIRFAKLLNGGGHILVDLKINEKKANILIDTGASSTVLDASRLERFVPDAKLKELNKLSTGLGTSSMQGHSILINEMELGVLKITSFTTTVLDLSNVNASYKMMKLKPIDGVLGGDILNKYKAVIDYRKKILMLEVPVTPAKRKPTPGRK